MQVRDSHVQVHTCTACVRIKGVWDRRGGLGVGVPHAHTGEEGNGNGMA